MLKNNLLSAAVKKNNLFHFEYKKNNLLVVDIEKNNLSGIYLPSPPLVVKWSAPKSRRTRATALWSSMLRRMSFLTRRNAVSVLWRGDMPTAEAHQVCCYEHVD